jgi:uncharacterized cupredoxin-like copper-binding protein
MSSTAKPDTSASDDFDEDPPAEPAGSGDILLGAGQSMWLGLVTVGTILALALSIVAIVMSRSEGGSEGGGEGATAGPTSSLTISAIDIAFEPDSWTVTADAEADVTLNNDGALEHNWTALELGVSITTEDEFDAGTVVAGTDDIAGGESGTVSATFAPGTYQVICTIAGHFSAGMTGSLTAA